MKLQLWLPGLLFSNLCSDGCEEVLEQVGRPDKFNFLPGRVVFATLNKGARGLGEGHRGEAPEGGARGVRAQAPAPVTRRVARHKGRPLAGVAPG